MAHGKLSLIIVRRIMMQLSTVFLLLLVVAFGCKSSREKTKNVTYSKDGICFNLPKYWKIKKDRPIEGVADSRFISISNEEPFSEDAFIIITAIDSVSKDLTLQNLIKQSSISYAKRKIEFSLMGKPQTITIGDKKGIRANFETRLLAHRNTGSFTVLQLKNKTFTFTTSSSVKDKLENFSVVDSVIASLALKKS